MVSEASLLKYFYKLDKEISLYDLMAKYETNDSILKPINSLIDNEWVERWNNEYDIYKITDEGKIEQELRDNARKPQPSTVVIGNQNAVGNTQSSFDKSFNAEESKSSDAKKSKITTETILKITAAIIAVVLAILKGFGII